MLPNMEWVAGKYTGATVGWSAWHSVAALAAFHQNLSSNGPLELKFRRKASNLAVNRSRRCYSTSISIDVLSRGGAHVLDDGESYPLKLKL